MKKINWFKLLVSLIGTFIFMSIGILLGGDTGKYLSINLPSFAPPKIVFPIVWSALYLLISISIYLIWCTVVANENEVKLKKISVGLYLISMLLNAAWPLVFFRLEQYLTAFVIAAAIIISCIASMVVAFKLNRISSYLLIPYLLWLAYAAYLNFEIFRLN